jgi:hypothetical protein
VGASRPASVLVCLETPKVCGFIASSERLGVRPGHCGSCVSVFGAKVRFFRVRFRLLAVMVWALIVVLAPATALPGVATSHKSCYGLCQAI